jgi:hypothetical protein
VRFRLASTGGSDGRDPGRHGDGSSVRRARRSATLNRVTPLGGDLLEGFGGYRFWTCYFARSLIASWQFDITDTNSAGYIEVGRSSSATTSSPPRMPTTGFKLGWRENTEQEEMDGGLAAERRSRSASRREWHVLGPLRGRAFRVVRDNVATSASESRFSRASSLARAAKLERDFTIPRAKFASCLTCRGITPRVTRCRFPSWRRRRCRRSSPYKRITSRP